MILYMHGIYELQSIIYVAADNALTRNHFGNLESANIDLMVPQVFCSWVL